MRRVQAEWWMASWLTGWLAAFKGKRKVKHHIIKNVINEWKEWEGNNKISKSHPWDVLWCGVDSSWHICNNNNNNLWSCHVRVVSLSLPSVRVERHLQELWAVKKIDVPLTIYRRKGGVSVFSPVQVFRLLQSAMWRYVCGTIVLRNF